MNSRRSDAVRGLIALAASELNTDRMDAARGLASLADIPDASRALTVLVLDPDDTAVTLETSMSLLRRHDVTGLQILAEALADADENHHDWIQTAVEAVLGIYSSETEAAVS